MLKVFLGAAAIALIATGCASVDAAVTATAEQDADQNAQNQNAQGRNAPGHSKQRFVATYDVDGDGVVSKAEFIAEREIGYGRRDINGDGEVHSEEYVAEYEERLEARLNEERERQIEAAYVQFGFMDSDDDEAMTLTEFHASGERMFSRLDTNEDGVVDEEDTADSF